MLNMSHWVKLLSTFAFAWSLLFPTAAGLAQESPRPQAEGRQARVGDDEIRAFVKAYVETQKIRQKYEPTLLETTDPEKNKQLHTQASAELKESLARQNLTVEQYNTIYAQVNSDEELRQKALKLIEEERKRSS
jgi:hypothetical protein